MSSTTPRRIWLLRLVPDWRFGRSLAGLAVAALLFGLYWSVGIFGAGEPSQASPTAAAFFCVILAYIVPVFHHITARTEQTFRELSPALHLEPGLAREWEGSIARKTGRWHILVLSAGAVAGIAHTTILFDSIASIPSRPASLAIVLGTVLVWTAMTSVITALVQNALLFNRLAHRVRIDLLNMADLTGFARVAVISTLAVIGAQASFPIMWLDTGIDLPALRASIPGFIAIGIPMVFLFALPIYPVHRAVAAAKAAELERIGHLLERARGADRSARSDDSELIARIAPLLAYRREITQVHEWPFDTGLVTRLAFYLIIPPLTWIGAALIENIVDGLL